MQPLDLVSLFTAPLERCGVPYFVTGSVAALLYGEPRMTHDVDLVLTLSDREIPRVLEAFPESDFYVPPLDVVLIEVRRPNMSSCESSHGFAKAGRRNTSATFEASSRSSAPTPPASITSRSTAGSTRSASPRSGASCLRKASLDTTPAR